MNPAEELRAAAKLMRERAQAASAGPWSVKFVPAPGLSLRAYSATTDKHMITGQDGNVADGGMADDAAHIASWHPGVAHAVADWLDIEAGILEKGLPDPTGGWAEARAVARAYLGTEESGR